MRYSCRLPTRSDDDERTVVSVLTSMSRDSFSFSRFPVRFFFVLFISYHPFILAFPLSESTSKSECTYHSIPLVLIPIPFHSSYLPITSAISQPTLDNPSSASTSISPFNIQVSSTFDLGFPFFQFSDFPSSCTFFLTSLLFLLSVLLVYDV